MKVALTGGTGFLGQNLIRNYGDRYEFRTITSRASTDGLSQKAEYIHAPYTQEGYSEAFQGCEAIVHLGASIPKSSLEKGTLEKYMDNVLNSERVFGAAVSLGIRQVINVSSVSVYDKKSPMPMREDTSPCTPDNYYGYSKVAVELLAELYMRNHDIRIVSLRVGQVLGEREDNAATGLLRMLIEKGYAKETMELRGKGIAARDFIYVDDVSRAIVCALEHPEVSGPINISNGAPVTNLELAEIFRAAAGSTAEIIHHPVENEDSQFWYMDITKAKENIGFTPAFTLEAAASDIFRKKNSAV